MPYLQNLFIASIRCDEGGESELSSCSSQAEALKLKTLILNSFFPVVDFCFL